MQLFGINFAFPEYELSNPITIKDRTVFDKQLVKFIAFLLNIDHDRSNTD